MDRFGKFRALRSLGVVPDRFDHGHYCQTNCSCTRHCHHSCCWCFCSIYVVLAARKEVQASTTATNNIIASTACYLVGCHHLIANTSMISLLYVIPLCNCQRSVYGSCVFRVTSYVAIALAVRGGEFVIDGSRSKP